MRPLLWLDPGEERLRLDQFATMASVAFLPLAVGHSSRGKKVSARHPPLRYGPFPGASLIVLAVAIAIEVAMVRTRGNGRSHTMATIGTFQKVGDEYLGEIITLEVQARNVRIIPETAVVSDNAPTHRIYVGRAEIGAAWARRTADGRDYLAVALDDPSFSAAINASLIQNADLGFNLIWSRRTESTT
jgi:uncharacterized protein (DUF736 family)